jgi:hypothetical protein
MNRFKKFLVAAFMSAAMLLPNMVQAMEIQQFDKMAVPDQGEYVGRLIAGAEQVFNDEGRSDLAEKVVQLFTTTEPGDAATLGNVEFQRNLARARLADAMNVQKNPNAHRLEVEDAMLVTLKKNNIPLSEDFIGAFRAVNNNFQSQSPPAAPTPPPPQ